ncbi:hypothetical protein K3495_g15985, partial [Podosphaera aphanis]
MSYSLDYSSGSETNTPSSTDTLHTAPPFASPITMSNEVSQQLTTEMLEMIRSMQDSLVAVQQQLHVVTQERDQARTNQADQDTVMTSSGTPASSHFALASGAATAATVKRPKHKLPELEKFSGKRTEYRIWALVAKQKIKKDGEAIGTPGDQFDYIFARMETEAQNLVAVYYERGLTAGFTATQFLAHLDTIFVDPNATKRALSRLTNTPQRDNESFALYLPKFERLLHEAGVEGDINCISYLEN